MCTRGFAWCNQCVGCSVHFHLEVVQIHTPIHTTKSKLSDRAHTVWFVLLSFRLPVDQRMQQAVNVQSTYSPQVPVCEKPDAGQCQSTFPMCFYTFYPSHPFFGTCEASHQSSPKPEASGPNQQSKWAKQNPVGYLGLSRLLDLTVVLNKSLSIGFMYLSVNQPLGALLKQNQLDKMVCFGIVLGGSTQNKRVWHLLISLGAVLGIPVM